MNTDADATADWSAWIGRSERRTERLDIEAARRFAAALGESQDVEAEPPSLVHWGFFLPVTASAEIGSDGHPRRGGLIPPITLPRRMFAAATMRFMAPLILGEEAEKISTVSSITQKTGRSGALVLVEIEHEIVQRNRECVRERQTIVYRDAGAPTQSIEELEIAQPGDEIWRPDPVELFRFSAVTFNSHRIHYDLPYAMREEGYPGLVVHGPLTACRLFQRARRHGVPAGFAFRAVAPIFCGQPIMLRGGGDQVRAVRADGVDAMIADVIS